MASHRLHQVTLGLVGLLLLAGPVRAAGGPGDAPLRIRVRTTSGVVLHDLEAADVERAFEKRLEKVDRLALVGAAEEAELTVEIVRATRTEQARVEMSGRRGPFRTPAGTFVEDQEYGARTNTVRRFALETRLTAGPRFVLVSSKPDDASLTEAVDTVVDRLERLVRERRDWLLGTGG